MNTQYRKNLKDVATACKNYTDKRFEDFKWELGTHTIDTTTDSDVAYQKQAPNGTIGCQINSVGGMSYKSENLLVLEDSTFTSSGITFTISGGKISSSGTSSTTGWITLKSFSLIAGSYSYNDFSTATTKVYFLNTSYQQLNPQFSLSETSTIYLAVKGSTIINNGQLINSMPMLVKGSTAPTTFKQGFEGIRDSAVTSIVANSTLNIPASIQALTGYGWGIDDTCYNYIDLNTKKFVQKVGRYTITGNETFEEGTISNNDKRFLITLPSDIKTTNVANVANAIMNIPQPLTSGNNIYTNVVIGWSINNQKINFYDSTIQTLADFRAFIIGKTIYYELATPVETDISSYITDNDKFLEVESLGTITFTNTYEQEVPSEITYLTEVAK